MALNIRTKGSSFLVRTRWGSEPNAPPSPGLGTQVVPSRSNSNEISPVVSRSASWSTTHPTWSAKAPWGLGTWDPEDVAVCRFAEPAVIANKQNLSRDISEARSAYAKAFVAIAKSTKNGDATALLRNSSEKDVAEAALGLMAGLAADKNAISRFIDILHHYHGVFDVLCQIDFSFLTVLWGGMKLILIMSKNRGDLTGKLTDMLVDIGLALSRVEVLVKLYPTTRMVELTSRLYAAVLEFLEEVILLFRRSAVRQVFSSLIRPFDEKFGRAIDRIQRVEGWIQKDALVLQAMQTASIAHHQFDSLLQRQHVEVALAGIPEGHIPDIFLKIKDTLFKGFEHQASYHESLAATYGVTTGAWKQWFNEEQRYLPSNASSASRLTQGLCDAPDFQHALQWKELQKVESPHIPSAYIIWTPDMTAHSAIASLILQIIQQRPTVISERNLDINMFIRANSSITALWNMFVNLMKVLGGCLIYISIGSVGPDEFAVVEKFVKAVRNWDGPPICITIIHPFNEGFVCDDNATDIDGLYDVHPSLTTTDALQHVLMLELDIHEVPQTIRTLLWDAVWRETRYASIGVSFRHLMDVVRRAAVDLSLERVNAQELSEEGREYWLLGVGKWMDNKVASNNVREQIQRHLDMVDLGLPDDVFKHLNQQLKLLVFRVDVERVSALGTRVLTQKQRDEVWGMMEKEIRPGPDQMFCQTVRKILEEVLDSYSEIPSRNAKQASMAILKLLDERFGWDGNWKEGISDNPQLIVESIHKGIRMGFKLVIEALLEREEGICGS